MNRLLVHADRVTPRLRYIAGLMLGERLGLEVSFAEGGQTDGSEVSGILCYGDSPSGEFPFMRAHGLLAETGLREFDVPMVTDREGHRVPFAVNGEDALFDFDPLAAAFFLITRYEEFFPSEKDMHGRYDGRQSLAFREGFLGEPVIDQWVLRLRDVLKRAFPDLKCTMRSYRFTPTIDIDNAYAYRHKGLLLNLGGAFRSLMHGQGVGERLRVLTGRASDPYDSYSFLRKAHELSRLRPIFFMLLADRSRYDRNLPHDHPAMMELIGSLAYQGEMGIHPGYGSGRTAEGIIKEKERLEAMLGEKVVRSRHHFIRISLPGTYRCLLEAGIEHDYSMGHADLTGFRAGTSDSFLFYDIGREAVTTLRVHPFPCMDVTLRGHLGLSPKEAVAVVAELAGKVRAVNGHMMTLWHNESAGGRGIWEGWQDVYREVLEAASPDR